MTTGPLNGISHNGVDAGVADHPRGGASPQGLTEPRSTVGGPYSDKPFKSRKRRKGGQTPIEAEKNSSHESRRQSH